MLLQSVTRKKEFPRLVEEEELKEMGTPTTLVVSRHPGVTSAIPPRQVLDQVLHLPA